MYYQIYLGSVYRAPAKDGRCGVWLFIPSTYFSVSRYLLSRPWIKFIFYMEFMLNFEIVFNKLCYQLITMFLQFTCDWPNRFLEWAESFAWKWYLPLTNKSVNMGGRRYPYSQCMMTSSNGNNGLVTGPLCGNLPMSGEFLSQSPVTRSFDAFFDLHLNKPLSKQSWGWWFQSPSYLLWRHYNGILKRCPHEHLGIKFTIIQGAFL